MNNEIISANDCYSILTNQNVTKPIGNDNLPQYWDKNYIEEIIDRTNNIKHQTLYRFLWMTGSRITEAINLRKADIDFNNYTVRIRWLKSRKWNYRTVPLHPKLRDILQIYVASMKSDTLLFDFTRQRAYNIVKRDFKGNPHMFRHSFAVHWMRSGGKTEVLSQMLGHSDIKTTLIYQRIVPVDIGKELIKVSF